MFESAQTPYLAALAVREADTWRQIIAQGPDLALSEAMRPLTQAHGAQTARVLRRAKRQVALITATADITGTWKLEKVTSTLSDLAEATLQTATDHLLRAARDSGTLRLPYPATPSRLCGFCVLAMGKLGARELNFSSDVDLILIYDQAAHAYTGDEAGAIFTRLARSLVILMAQRDADGYVFRVDLRLRPDPASTPPAISLAAALVYYEGAAQTWERAAMIKARPVAGDLALGARFLDAIKPFIWRRHLDFAAIADILAMKQRMDTHTQAALKREGTPAARLLGHDIKLGHGGIREVEFCAQTLQLVWGGRNQALRVRGTLEALAQAAKAGHLPRATAGRLAAGYTYLRRVEHRLQMVDDRQTHTLPATLAALAGFAAFFGAPSVEEFAATLLAHVQFVHRAFNGVLAGPVAAPDSSPDSAGQDTPMPKAAPGPSPAPPILAPTAQTLVQGWLAGKPRAMRTERARALLREMLPAIAATIERQPVPPEVWTRFDDFLYALPAGVQLFSMLRHHPALLERLGDVLGCAPWLAGHLAARPAALEGLIAPQPAEDAAAPVLATQLRDARGLDDALNIASQFVRAGEFRMAVAEFFGGVTTDAAGLARTGLAEAAIGGLLPLVMREHRRRFGRLPGGAMVVVALGRAGAREMFAGSDLDLMLIYDHPEAPGTASSASQYFARAAQAVVAALTTPTRDGKLYDVDMRLRPSGGKGPVAVSRAAFDRYHRENAWTWERLALTRARVVAGPRWLARRVTHAIEAALQAGNQDQVRADTLAMRRRLLALAPSRGVWDIRARAGGLRDLAFIAESLTLRHAKRPGRSQSTRAMLATLAHAGILPQEQAARLTDADRVWRAVQGHLRIAYGRTLPPDSLPRMTWTVCTRCLTG